MEMEKAESLFLLADIEVLKMWEIKNLYWPAAYKDLIEKSPWWLVKTSKGLIQIGWRKRVISINWEDTEIEVIVTEDNVTKLPYGVHAYSYEKAIEYLKVLSPLLTENRND